MTQIINDALFHSTAKHAQFIYHEKIKGKFREWCASFSTEGYNEYLKSKFTNTEWSGPQKTTPVFFKPFKDRYDFFARAASIPLASVGLILEAAEDLLLAGLTLCFSLLKSFSCDWKGAKEEFKTGVEFFVTAIEKIVMALVSPLVNLIDLLGSSVKTVSGSLTNHSINDEAIYTYG